MAVIQISKIQVRRGQKLSGIGVPQLSSAEFAWAVDSQELFIGNGSVAEGAPYVGNTKILTEHDNILELASSYTFDGEDPTISLSVPRSLQSKLDEYVSVIDFGAIGDGSSDNIEFFQNAVDQLFKNQDTSFKKTLMIPNGTYLLSSGDLKIPSTALIRGETQNGAIIDIGANNIVFVTEDGEEVGAFTGTNRPVDIKIGNLTIRRTTGQTVITGVADSNFEGVRFLGGYELGDTVSDITIEPSSVFWENGLADIKVTNVTFKDCIFESVSLGVRSDQVVVDSSALPTYDTFINFDSCRFFVNHTGILINGVNNQGNKWKIINSDFEEIAQRAFRADYGVGTLISKSRFINCGNNTNSANNPVTEIISFGQNKGNTVTDCISNRHQIAGFTAVNTKAGIGEVENAGRVSFLDLNYSDIYTSNSFRPLSVFSALSRYIIVDYTLSLGVHTRKGQLEITIDEDFEHASISDNYSYSPELITSSGGQRMTNFEFNVSLRDNDGESGIDTLVLTYQNPLATGTTGTIQYLVSYGV